MPRYLTDLEGYSLLQLSLIFIALSYFSFGVQKLLTQFFHIQ